MVTSFTYVIIFITVGVVLMKWIHQLYHLRKCCRNLFMCYVW